ncbi:MAG: hypothetical protein E7632_12400, partial [Ruminococcaceae bacterium]|nr:hypothetical protein [Oscillospiraceae bacterium]
MAFVGNNENRRSQEYAERSFAESVLGRRLEIRIYAQHEDLARGTVMLTDGGGYQVFTAYLACAGKILAAGDIAEGQAVGMLIDRENGGVTVLLDAGDADTAAWTQSRIAETVDYWESANSPRIYCLREKSCGAVVFTEVDGERRFLVIRMNLGHCGLPKGHMEKYETEQETA